MQYEPQGNVPIDPKALQQFLTAEFGRLSEIFSSGIENLLIPEYNAEPAKPRDGLVVRADGTNWNPGGTGAGFYGYRNGAWHLLG